VHAVYRAFCVPPEDPERGSVRRVLGSLAGSVVVSATALVKTDVLACASSRCPTGGHTSQPMSAINDSSVRPTLGTGDTHDE
jgi:hypothetical protein